MGFINMPYYIRCIFTLILYTLMSFCIIEPILAKTKPAQTIPANRLLSDDELISLLGTNTSPILQDIQTTYAKNKENGLRELAKYFKKVYGQRYYFHWADVDKRFPRYKNDFKKVMIRHTQKKDIHLSLYPADTQWKRPFTNLQGNQVSAYELRHLARQHKVLDMAYAHLAEDRNPAYVTYFTTQMRSLNKAFTNQAYADDNSGNGVFESYRAGTRVINWLEIHAFYLGSPDYTWRDQIDFIRSMLLEGAILNKKNQTFRPGNHQTRGVNALAMLAILFSDYNGTSQWYSTAMNILEQHLIREVNSDGFQFERSVHYHIDDIFNYFYAYKLAKNNNFHISDTWEKQLKAMFDAIVSLARPDKNLPVSSDDTDKFMAENNAIDSVMLLGALLFDDPTINYFASTQPTNELYWYLSEDDLQSISAFQKRKPTISSTALTHTGFYIMRDGWESNGLYMNISAGKSKLKPDHQHGDMLGVTAFGFNNELLPNYQIRYTMEDLPYFKNSFSKNVAIADDIPQGLIWRSNAGGSGFGKWQTLPLPRTINWKPETTWDYYLGTHDGFIARGIDYYRKVFFLKGSGWIIKDIFHSNEEHNYQQIWQGHYTQSTKTGHHTATFENGIILDIVQLADQPTSANLSEKQGKGHVIYANQAKNTNYTTLIYPHQRTNTSSMHAKASIDVTADNLNIGDWILNDTKTTTHGISHDAEIVLSHSNEWFLFNTQNIKINKGKLNFSEATDIYIQKISDKKWRIDILSIESIKIKTSRVKLTGNASRPIEKDEKIYPGDTLNISIK